MFTTVRRLVKNESGATAIEYGLIAALVAVAAVVALGTLGDQLVRIFGVVSTDLSTAADTATGTGGENPAPTP